MKKKIIIGSVIVVLIIVVTVLTTLVIVKNTGKDKKSSSNAQYEKIAKEFVDAVKSEKDMDEYLDKYYDFETEYALDNVPNSDQDSAELKKEIEELIEDMDDEDLENKEYYYSGYERYCDLKLELEFKKISKVQDYDKRLGSKTVTATYLDEDDNEIEIQFVFYKDKFLYIMAITDLFGYSDGSYIYRDYLKDEEHLGKIINKKEDIEEFDKEVVKLIDDFQMKGSEVKDLIDDVIELNEEFFDEDTLLTLNIEPAYIDDYLDSDDDNRNDAYYEVAYGKRTEGNLKKYADELKKLKAAIDSKEEYDVIPGTNEYGRIEYIRITPSDEFED